MEDYKVKQIWPAHADHISCYREKYLNEMFEKEQVIAQRKYDGERMLVHLNGNETYCTSRRQSKKTGRYMENQDKIKDLTGLTATIPTELGYTVIDCECYSNSWSDIVGILHSLPERAYELQKTVPVKFAVFDCIWFDGVDISGLPYRLRLQYVDTVLSMLRDERFHMVENIQVHSLQEAYTIAQQHWDLGLEGVVVKSLDKAYYDKGAMLKIKRHETVDLVVYEMQPGSGKYANTVGALLCGYYDEETGTIKHVTKVNCGTDADRDWWKNFFDSLPINRQHGEGWKVLEVKAQEVTETSLRHPVYVRVRDDKSYTMCTRDTIFK